MEFILFICGGIVVWCCFLQNIVVRIIVIIVNVFVVCYGGVVVIIVQCGVVIVFCFGDGYVLVLCIVGEMVLCLVVIGLVDDLVCSVVFIKQVVVQLCICFCQLFLCILFVGCQCLYVVICVVNGFQVVVGVVCQFKLDFVGVIDICDLVLVVVFKCDVVVGGVVYFVQYVYLVCGVVCQVVIVGIVSYWVVQMYFWKGVIKEVVVQCIFVEQFQIIIMVVQNVLGVIWVNCCIIFIVEGEVQCGFQVDDIYLVFLFMYSGVFVSGVILVYVCQVMQWQY